MEKKIKNKGLKTNTQKKNKPAFVSLKESMSPRDYINLQLIVAELIRPHKNPRANMAGLIFAAGLNVVNPPYSQAQMARELGCTRALVSFYTKEWSERIKGGAFQIPSALNEEKDLGVFKSTPAWSKKR